MLGAKGEAKPSGQHRHSYHTRSNARIAPNRDLAEKEVAEIAEKFQNLKLKSVEEEKEEDDDGFAGEEDDDGFAGEAGNRRFHLSDEQKNVLSNISEGRSVFFTGAAGTGKTFLLGQAIVILKDLHGENTVFVTASTGIAASKLNGTTVHSFAGIGCALEKADSLLSKVRKKRDSQTRWKKAKALVIDEINMIDGELFDKLNFIAKGMKGNDQHFGGLQLVVAGDFCQLCPVNPPNPQKFFAFQADCWDRCFDVKIELARIFRQKNPIFQNMLNEIRMGICSNESIKMLQNQQGLPVEEGVSFTRVYFRKTYSLKENEQMLKALGNEIKIFYAQDSGDERARSQLESLLAVKELCLCIGAQVMLIYNLDTKNGLVNGRRGEVVGFQATNESPDISPGGVWPVVKFEGVGSPRTVTPCAWDAFDEKGEASGRRIQVPLVLAWALSVFKCQGRTLERVETDLSTLPDTAYGLAYLVLSRLEKLEGLRLTEFESSKIRAHPKVIEFYERFRNKT